MGRLLQDSVRHVSASGGVINTTAGGRFRLQSALARMSCAYGSNDAQPLATIAERVELQCIALPERAGHLDLLAEVRGLVLDERVLGDLEPRLRRLLPLLLPLGGISADGVRAGYGPPRKMTLFGSLNI